MRAMRRGIGDGPGTWWIVPCLQPEGEEGGASGRCLMPSSPRGWLCWALSVSERYTRPHGVRYIYDGWTDRRMDDRRETSISIRMLAEKASHTVCGNGIGYQLLIEHFAGEASWWSFTEPEQRIIEKTAKAFSRMLRETGFIEGKG